MKKYLALLLSMLLLVGCARIEPEQGGTKPEPGQPDDVSAKLLSQYALAEVKLPELPAEPSEEELWAAYEKLDYDKMGEEAYHKAQEELWDDFDARSRAYSDAVKALRGEGVDKTMTPALLGYSTKTVSKLLGGEAAANVVYSPANLYLALSMLTETVDGETRAQLLDLLGAEDEETVRTTANAIWRSLYTDSANSKTLLANSLWLSEGQAYKTETVERLANDYYASVFSAPMGTGDTNKAVQAWLNTNTGGLLADAAKNIETKPQTVMLLLSALYFKDRWSDEFYDGATSEDTFTAADGTAQRADFMHKTEGQRKLCPRRGLHRRAAFLPRRGAHDLPAARRGHGAHAAAARRSGADRSLHRRVRQRSGADGEARLERAEVRRQLRSGADRHAQNARRDGRIRRYAGGLLAAGRF